MCLLLRLIEQAKWISGALAVHAGYQNALPDMEGSVEVRLSSSGAAQ